MTAQFLVSELSGLIQDSKRKNADLKNAAEKSLQDLKALHVTSEEQLAADLNRRSQFINPFLIACATQNAKFATPGTVCLQRLSVSRGIPKERLRDVLEALRQCTALSLDIQLKVLQTLPALLQNYSSELKGELLASTLSVCSSLQAVKNPAVSSTAIATLQQLVTSVFDKVSDEDERSLEIPCTAEVPGKSGPVSVRAAAHDAYKVFHDLCLIAEGNQPKYVRFSVTSQASGLELVETILTNHGAVFSTHPEQGHILCTLVMPLIVRCLAGKLSFQITVRAMRILQILVREHLSILSAESEAALSSLSRMLEENVVTWKRALALELFRSIFTDPLLIVEIYASYDQSEDRSPIIRDSLASFVRMATEKPSAIGLGQQSTTPFVRNDNRDEDAEQAAMEAGAVAGIIGGTSVSTNATGTGLSTQWSTMRTSCIDLLDKTEPPTLPETYIYGLVLTCINNLSESLAKFILPLTVHTESRTKRKNRAQELAEEEASADSDPNSPAKSKRKLSRTQSFRKKTVPVNPLSLGNHSGLSSIRSAADLVDTCWPAVLTTCSTFLNASLDNDYYRALVRSFQKFTQVAGLLRLSTPRDAFLTTLGKNAIPASVMSTSVTSPKSPQTENNGMFANPKGLLSVDSLVSQVSSRSFDRSRRGSVDHGPPLLNARNLLCLRALLNLAIALGPTLESAWSIIFETLQQADIILAVTTGKGAGREPRSTQNTQSNQADSNSQDVSSEAAAVQAAASRLFESTVDFPNDAFVNVLEALCGLVRSISKPPQSIASSSESRPAHQRRVGSMSGISLHTDAGAQEYMFALGKVGDLAALNLHRLTHYSSTESGWNTLSMELIKITESHTIPPQARRMSAEIISQIGQDMAKLSMSEEPDIQRDVQLMFLKTLLSQIAALYKGTKVSKHDEVNETTVEIHDTTLQALKSMLEQCGESLTAGWESVFDILGSVFHDVDPNEDHTEMQDEEAIIPSDKVTYVTSHAKAKKLARSAFESVQLVCSDFLSAIPTESMTPLLDLILRFSSQDQDLNMSLTTITFLWNVSDYLSTRTTELSLGTLTHLGGEGVDTSTEVRESASKGSISALWLLVLLHLTAISTDRRIEVRNGAIQTILRIFQNSGDDLDPGTWHVCLQAVLFRMIDANLEVQETLQAKASKADLEKTRAWHETAGVVLNVASSLFANYNGPIAQAATFDDIWHTTIQFWKRYLACNSHSLNKSTYSAISAVLSKVKESEALKAEPSSKVLHIWLDHIPEEKQEQETADTNQEAFTAYVQAFADIYGLFKDDLDSKAGLRVLTNFQSVIERSLSTPYSSDVDYPTNLQKLVIECLSELRSDKEQVPSCLLKLLASFITLPYRKAGGQIAPNGPSYVALSKAAMKLADRVSVRHVAVAEIYSSGAIHIILKSLALAISQKYKWRLEGKVTSSWQTATKSAIAIIKPVLDHLETASFDKKETSEQIWAQVVTIAENIAHADLDAASPSTPLVSDEDFDIAALRSLRDIIIPSLGAASILDTTRRTNTFSLFRSSLIHAAEAGEIPRDADDGPLHGLYKMRFGRTYDPAPTPRTKMAFFCLSELISMVSVRRDSSPKHIKLAQAAAPYLILRAALPIKAYIADQPLRGRMPQPESQRQELLFVLKEIVEMDSEPKAIPDAPGVSSARKKHLHRLYPLLTKAVRVAGRDEEILKALMGALEAVGDEFGI